MLIGILEKRLSKYFCVKIENLLLRARKYRRWSREVSTKRTRSFDVCQTDKNVQQTFPDAKDFFLSFKTRKERSKMILSPCSTKCSKGDKIILNENDKCASNDGKLCQIFFMATSPILFLNFKSKYIWKYFKCGWCNWSSPNSDQYVSGSSKY